MLQDDIITLPCPAEVCKWLSTFSWTTWHHPVGMLGNPCNRAPRRFVTGFFSTPFPVETIWGDHPWHAGHIPTGNTHKYLQDLNNQLIYIGYIVVMDFIHLLSAIAGHHSSMWPSWMSQEVDKWFYSKCVVTPMCIYIIYLYSSFISRLYIVRVLTIYSTPGASKLLFFFPDKKNAPKERRWFGTLRRMGWQ